MSDYAESMRRWMRRVNSPEGKASIARYDAEHCGVRWDARGTGFTCHCVLLESHDGPHRCTCGAARHYDGQEAG